MQVGMPLKAPQGVTVVRFSSVELYVSQKEVPYVAFNFDVDIKGELAFTRYYVSASDIPALSALVQMLRKGNAVVLQQGQTPEMLVADIQHALSGCVWEGKAYINDRGNVFHFVLPPDMYLFSWAGWSNPIAPVRVSEVWGRPQATAILQVAQGSFAGTRVYYSVGARVNRDSAHVVRSLPSNNLAYLLTAFLDKDDLDEIEKAFPDDQAVFVALGELISRKRRLVRGAIDADGRLAGQTLTRDTGMLSMQEQDDDTPVRHAWDELADNMNSISSKLGRGVVEQNGQLTEDGGYVARNVLAPIVGALQAFGFDIKRKWRDPTCSPDAIGLAASLMYMVGEEVLSREDNLMYVGESDQSHQALESWVTDVLLNMGVKRKKSHQRSDEF